MSGHTEESDSEAALTNSIRTWIRIAPGIVGVAGMLLSLGMCPKLDTFQTKVDSDTQTALLRAEISVTKDDLKLTRQESREDAARLNAKLDRVLEILATQRNR